MAYTFKLETKKNIGTADSAVYTCPGGTATTIIGMNLANTTSSAITADSLGSKNIGVLRKALNICQHTVIIIITRNLSKILPSNVLLVLIDSVILSNKITTRDKEKRTIILIPKDKFELESCEPTSIHQINGPNIKRTKIILKKVANMPVLDSISNSLFELKNAHCII